MLPISISITILISIGDSPAERGDAGQRLALQEFQRRAAAGGEMADALGVAELLQRGDRVAAADDDRRAGSGSLADRMADSARAGGELWHLEDPHRPVPDDRLRGADSVREEPPRGGTDVDADL